MFPKLLNVRRDRCIRHFENFRDAAIIHLDLEYLRVRVALRKFENVLKIRAAPRIDRLRVIAHYHHIPMIARQKIDKIGLDLVRVLVFVHQNELKLAPVKLGINDDSYYEITEGVKEGEEVVSGSFRAISRELEDGKKVKKGALGMADKGEKDGKSGKAD